MSGNEWFAVGFLAGYIVGASAMWAIERFISGADRRAEDDE